MNPILATYKESLDRLKEICTMKDPNVKTLIDYATASNEVIDYENLSRQQLISILPVIYNIAGICSQLLEYSSQNHPLLRDEDFIASISSECTLSSKELFQELIEIDKPLGESLIRSIDCHINILDNLIEAYNTKNETLFIESIKENQLNLHIFSKQVALISLSKFNHGEDPQLVLECINEFILRQIFSIIPKDDVPPIIIKKMEWIYEESMNQINDFEVIKNHCISKVIDMMNNLANIQSHLSENPEDYECFIRLKECLIKHLTLLIKSIVTIYPGYTTSQKKIVDPILKNPYILPFFNKAQKEYDSLFGKSRSISQLPTEPQETINFLEGLEQYSHKQEKQEHFSFKCPSVFKGDSKEALVKFINLLSLYGYIDNDIATKRTLYYRLTGEYRPSEFIKIEWHSCPNACLNMIKNLTNSNKGKYEKALKYFSFPIEDEDIIQNILYNQKKQISSYADSVNNSEPYHNIMRTCFNIDTKR